MMEIKNADVQTEIGINESDFTSGDGKKDTFIFLVAGRMIYRKGHKFLFDALKKVPKSLEYEVRIVGGGPDLKELKAICENDDNLSKHVVFTGMIPYIEMKNEYQKASAFIMPSLRETTGSVLLEAMANGLPVITINKFGGPVIFNETNGWLYDGKTKKEYIQNLSNILIECISNPEEVSRRGAKAFEDAQKYTWKEKGKHYQAIYEQLLNCK